jgi:hypothetical protein
MQLSGKQFGKGQRLHLFRSYLGSQIIIHNDLCTLDELNSFELQAQTAFTASGCVPRTVAGLETLTVKWSVEPGPDPTSQHLPGDSASFSLAEFLTAQLTTGQVLAIARGCMGRVVSAAFR